MAAFTIHRVHIVIPNAVSWYDDSDYYNSTSGTDDINETYIIFGVKEAWNLYRKEAQRLRKEYYDSWTITIESAIVPEGGIISGRKLGYYHGDGFEPLKELNWEILDTTIRKNERG